MGAIAGIFPIGETGESFVIAEWQPDPKVVEAKLFKLASDTENWAVPLTAARKAFIYDTSLHFETQSDPYGRAWTALSDEYAKHKLRMGYGEEGILHAEGTLEEAATSSDSWIMTERDILFDTSKLPFYGPYHQFGNIDENVQNVVSKLRSGVALTREEVGVSLESAGKGKNLPQRMFIGADEDTIAEVEGIFLEWLNKLVADDWHTPSVFTMTNIPAFGGGFSLRGASGQFVGALKP
jgi:hypothetical protein